MEEESPKGPQGRRSPSARGPNEEKRLHRVRDGNSTQRPVSDEEKSGQGRWKDKGVFDTRVSLVSHAEGHRKGVGSEYLVYLSSGV